MTTRASCYDVPRYHARLWRSYSDPNAAAVEAGATGDARCAGFSDGFMPELFHRMFADEPRAVAGPDRAAAMRAKLHAIASELPEMETLRRRTVHDATWSGMAATSLAEHVAGALPPLAGETPDADEAARVLRGMQRLAEQVGAEGAEAMGEAMARAEGSSAGASFAVGEQAEGLDESALRSALRAGAEAAQEAIDEAEQALQAFGWGDGDGGTSGAARDPAVAVELARRVASSATLRRIVELAGRLKACARAKRATRSDFARSEIVGIEPTDDFASLVPSELGCLAHPLLTADLAARVTERAGVGWELRGDERAKRGPLVILLDQSGSMDGDRDAWAKAVTLALLDAAKRDRRAFGVVLYAGHVTSAKLYPDPGKADPMELLTLLGSRADGTDTRFAPPMKQGLDWIERAASMRRADVVHVSDGGASSEDAGEHMRRAENIGAHVFGIAVGTDGMALRQWSHEVASISDVSQDTAATDLIFEGILP